MIGIQIVKNMQDIDFKKLWLKEPKVLHSYSIADLKNVVINQFMDVYTDFEIIK